MKFLVAYDIIVFAAGPIYQSGTIFKVASNDAGRGCYQAKEFDIYSDDPEEEIFFDEDDYEFFCVPATSVIEVDDYKEALEESYDLRDDLECTKDKFLESFTDS